LLKILIFFLSVCVVSWEEKVNFTAALSGQVRYLGSRKGFFYFWHSRRSNYKELLGEATHLHPVSLSWGLEGTKTASGTELSPAVLAQRPGSSFPLRGDQPSLLRWTGREKNFSRAVI